MVWKQKKIIVDEKDRRASEDEYEQMYIAYERQTNWSGKKCKDQRRPEKWRKNSHKNGESMCVFVYTQL